MNIQGKLITKVIDATDQYKEYDIADTREPKGLRTFELPLSRNKTLLCLDPYGAFDTSFPTEIAERAFGGYITDDSGGFTIGIIKQTGKIFLVSADEAENGNSVELTISNPFYYRNKHQPRIPKSFLNRLDELKSMKRPFGLNIVDCSMYAFISKEEGYRHLCESIVFSFEFENKTYLDVCGEDYRTRCEWRISE